MAQETDVSPFQTQSALRALLDSAGLRPNRRLGQCFLIDRNLMEKLLESAEVGPGDCVLEVGAATGSLTGLLARRAGRVVAVEVDAALAEIARGRLADRANVRLIRADALANKSTVSPVVETAVREALEPATGDLKLVANLPYDIATPLVVNLLLGPLPFRRLCFSVQQEVAERFLAAPAGGAYGPVSVITQLLAAGRRVTRLPPQAFWPAPKVSSAILRLDARPPEQVRVADPVALARFVRGFFQYRRKRLSHIARRLGLDARLLPVLPRFDISPNARPQDLSVEQWVSLFEATR